MAENSKIVPKTDSAIFFQPTKDMLNIAVI